MALISLGACQITAKVRTEKAEDIAGNISMATEKVGISKIAAYIILGTDKLGEFVPTSTSSINIAQKKRRGEVFFLHRLVMCIIVMCILMQCISGYRHLFKRI